MPSLDINSPLQDAVDQMAAKTAVGSPMLSREWGLLPAELKLRTMFSARVEHERTVGEMQARITDALAGRKRDGVTMDKGRFVEEMREIVRSTGYKRPDGTHRKSVQNLKSRARLELIWEMNMAQATGYAKWLSDMTPEGLENEPCYELVRINPRKEVRDWPLVWAQAGGKFYGGQGSNKSYPLAPGRMIAKKTDRIWLRISRFGVPWDPLDWGTGMGLDGIDIAEAEDLGVVSPGDEPQTPQAKPFNEDHSASAKAIPEAGREALRSAFGDAIKFDADRIRLQRHLSPETDEHRNLDITESLRQRAQGYYIQARENLQRLQRTDDGAEMGFRGEGESKIADIYIAQASAVAVGRKTLFHDTMTQAEAEVFMQATAGFPDSVARHYEAGHFMVWRRDLETLSPERIIAEIESHRGGLLLGYGLDSPAVLGEPHVLVRIFAAPRADGDLPLAGFHAPVASWRTYAEARAKDLSHAMAREMVAEAEVRS